MDRLRGGSDVGSSGRWSASISTVSGRGPVVKTFNAVFFAVRAAFWDTLGFLFPNCTSLSFGLRFAWRHVENRPVGSILPKF